MSKNQNIKCPECGSEFPIEDALSKKLEQFYEDQFQDRIKKYEKLTNSKIEEIKNKEKELKDLENGLEEKANILAESKKVEIETSLKQKLRKEFNFEIQSLKTDNLEQQNKIAELTKSQIENEQLKRKLKEQEQEIELKYEQKTTEELNRKISEIQKKESEKSELKLKEKDQLINSLKEQVEEVKRKAEQGSMERQGETQEIALQEILESLFPYDTIEPVPKGVKGADIIQIVKDKLGQEVGKIVYESKRTKSFSETWITKLKGDTVQVKGDLSIIVSEALPDDVEKIGLKEGVWICSYHDVKGIALSLREGLLAMGTLKHSQANQGTKMQLLYDYLVSNEFKLQIEAIINGFNGLQDGYLKEKRSMERIWKEREKQLEGILINTNHFIGSIQGIAGSSIPELQQIDTAGNLLVTPTKE